MCTGLTADFLDFAKVFLSSLVFFCIELEAFLLGTLHEVLNESPVLMLITTSDAGDFCVIREFLTVTVVCVMAISQLSIGYKRNGARTVPCGAPALLNTVDIQYSNVLCSVAKVVDNTG